MNAALRGPVDDRVGRMRAAARSQRDSIAGTGDTPVTVTRAKVLLQTLIAAAECFEHGAQAPWRRALSYEWIWPDLAIGEPKSAMSRDPFG